MTSYCENGTLIQALNEANDLHFFTNHRNTIQRLKEVLSDNLEIFSDKQDLENILSFLEKKGNGYRRNDLRQILAKLSIRVKNDSIIRPVKNPHRIWLTPLYVALTWFILSVALYFYKAGHPGVLPAQIFYYIVDDAQSGSVTTKTIDLALAANDQWETINISLNEENVTRLRIDPAEDGKLIQHFEIRNALIMSDDTTDLIPSNSWNPFNTTVGLSENTLKIISAEEDPYLLSNVLHVEKIDNFQFEVKAAQTRSIWRHLWPKPVR